MSAQGSGSRNRPSPLLIAAAAGGLAALGLGKTRRQRREEARAESRAAEERKMGHPNHAADGPTDVPGAGWMAVVKRTIGEISNDHVMLVAAGVTFYALLALFPAIAAFVSIYGLFADPASIQNQVASLQGVLPGGAVTILETQLESLAAQGSASLGLTFAFGLLVSLWSANNGVKAIFEALNIAYEETEKRGFIKLTLVTLAFTLGILLFIVVALGAIVAIPAVLSSMALGPVVEPLMRWLRWPILFVIVAGLISVIYRYGPSRENAKWRWITPGGFTAAFLWIVVSVLFSWYVANFGSYNETYGSLGAAVGFMTWIWISTIIVLACAELNSELEHQTRKDTTTGPDRPLGQRGAVMADRVVGGPKKREGRSGSL